MMMLPRFKNMDKLIHHANLDGRINAFYSTPSQYVAAKHAYDAAWPLKTDDFFPYADTPVSYWTSPPRQPCCSILARDMIS